MATLRVHPRETAMVNPKAVNEYMNEIVSLAICYNHKDHT